MVYVNGAIVDAADARISVFDRGLLHGDGLFETMRMEQGRVHMLGRHLGRLRAGAADLEIELPSDSNLRAAITAILSANGASSGALRLTATRGMATGAPGSDAGPTTLLIWQKPLLHIENPEPTTLATASIPHTPPPTAIRRKTSSYLGYALAAREAQRRGADEAVMIAADGSVAEGAISNLFIVRAGVLVTPPVDLGILPGIARGRVLELARSLGIEAREERFTIESLRSADECFFTNAVRGVVAVATVDGHPVSAAWPIADALQQAYEREIPDEAL